LQKSIFTPFEKLRTGFDTLANGLCYCNMLIFRSW